MVKNRIIYTFAIAALVLFYIYCDSYMPLVILLLAILLPIASAVTASISVKKLSVEVSPVLSSVVKEDDMNFNVAVKNLSRFPIPAVNVKLEYKDMFENFVLKNKIHTSAAAGEKKIICITVSSKHCAVVECKIKKARCCDFFGLVSFNIKNVNNSARIVVMPRFSENVEEHLSKPTAAADSDQYSVHEKGDDSSQVFEVREYVPGDDIRRIHWRLSSKQDKLIVKEYSKPIAGGCVLILETGIKSDDVNTFRERVDDVLYAFLTAANSFVKDGQSVSAAWYSKRRSGIFTAKIEAVEEIYNVVKEFLLEEFSNEKEVSLENFSFQRIIDNQRTYYICDSVIKEIG